jgi:hypothetical protein
VKIVRVWFASLFFTLMYCSFFAASFPKVLYKAYVSCDVGKRILWLTHAYKEEKLNKWLWHEKLEPFFASEALYTVCHLHAKFFTM